MQIADASLPTRIKVALGALKVLAKEPGNEAQATTFNAAFDAKRYHALAQSLRTSVEGSKLLDARPSLQGPEVPLDAFAALPEGTLGHEFGNYFKRNGISPFHSTLPIDSDFDFVGKRYRETHDLLHVLTGYATDPLGEMELQAFVFGNLKLHSTAFILMFAVPPMIKEGVRKFGDSLQRIRRAYVRGRKTRELLSVPYEQFWATPVSELVQQLGIAPA